VVVLEDRLSQACQMVDDMTPKSLAEKFNYLFEQSENHVGHRLDSLNPTFAMGVALDLYFPLAS